MSGGVAVVFVLVCAASAAASILSCEPLPSGTGVRCIASSSSALVTQMEAWGGDTIRVRIASGAISDTAPGAILPDPPAPHPTDAAADVATDDATVTSGNLRAELTGDGRVVFTHVSDNTTLAIQSINSYSPPDPVSKLSAINITVASAGASPAATEYVFGMGETDDALLNRRRTAIDFESCQEYHISHGSRVCIPFLLSSTGYSFFWNMPGWGYAAFDKTGASDNEPFSGEFFAEAAVQIDYLVSTSRAPKASEVVTPAAAVPVGIADSFYFDAMHRFVDAVGHAPPLPLWATGFWQSKNRYNTQQQLLDVARGYHERDVPVAVIVVDYLHWNLMGDWAFNASCWPDPSQMVHELSKLSDTRLMVSVWPFTANGSTSFDEFYENRYALSTTSGELANWPEGLCGTEPDGTTPRYCLLYDPSQSAARAAYWERVRAGYYSHGIKVWWIDGDEPESGGPLPSDSVLSIGPIEQVGMMWVLEHQRSFWEGMTQRDNETDVVLLSRSGWAGSQRYGAAVWNGDTNSTFEWLQKGVIAGLSIQMSGIAWWTSDIGGYRDGDITTPYFQELIVRWFQFGMFCPLFRLHGNRAPAQSPSAECGYTNGFNEIWHFGDPAYGIIKEIIRLRHRTFRNYIEHELKETARAGAPLMRPLFFDFPNDPNAYPPATASTESTAYQYMFGPSFMIAPVVTYGARNRTVYFPVRRDVQEWVLLWDRNERYVAGTSTVVPAPLDRIPVFVTDTRVFVSWDLTDGINQFLTQINQSTL